MLAEIKQAVGEERFSAECKLAQQAAPFTGSGLSSRNQPSYNSDLPCEVAHLVWDSSRTTRDKLQLIFAVYSELPCYGLIMYCKDKYPSFDEEARTYFWKLAREQLGHDEEMYAQPMAYLLWVDFFEDTHTVRDAWGNLLVGSPGERLLERLLDVSGPVPFDLKMVLYRQLMHRPKWHYPIFRSILHSSFDAYGDTDEKAARYVLRHLNLPKHTEHLETLRTRLR